MMQLYGLPYAKIECWDHLSEIPEEGQTTQRQPFKVDSKKVINLIRSRVMEVSGSNKALAKDDLENFYIRQLISQ